MDIQMKKGLLDVCVLAAVGREPSYGYQIVKTVRPFVDISESTLYPILRRLEAADCLTAHSMEHNGRLRRYYTLTPTGQARIDAFLQEWDQLRSIHAFIRLCASARASAAKTTENEENTHE